MSFKAIDGQIMLHKVNEVSRLQRLEQQQGQQLQDNAMTQVKKEANRHEKSVGKLNYTEHNSIDNKKEKNEQRKKRHTVGEGKSQINNPNDNEEQELNVQKHLGSIFDFRI